MPKWFIEQMKGGMKYGHVCIPDSLGSSMTQIAT